MNWRAVGCLGVSAVGFVGVLLALLLAFTFVGAGEIEDQQPLPNGGVVLRDGYVSVYLLPLAGGGYALVDTGNDDSGAVIDRALLARGAVRDDVKAILLTHAHPDHVAACAGFEDADIDVMRDELPLLYGEVAPKGPLPRMFGAHSSPCPRSQVVPVEDGAVVTLAPGVTARAFAVPGHTAGSAAWYVDGVLFLGDAADADRDGRLTTAKWLFSDHQRQATRSLVSLAERVRATQLPVQAMAFSHSGTIAGGEPLQAFAASRVR
ncbi:MAG: MBL fold metallo-hydrolase [Myxococcota bacterium]